MSVFEQACEVRTETLPVSHLLHQDGINISVDSLNSDIFKQITGHDRLKEILNGIKKLQKFILIILQIISFQQKQVQHLI